MPLSELSQTVKESTSQNKPENNMSTAKVSNLAIWYGMRQYFLVSDYSISTGMTTFAEILKDNHSHLAIVHGH